MGQKIKLSDYVISFLEKEGVTDIFLLSGGGCIHLVDSVGKSKKIHYICCLHEQAVAMATESYGRTKGTYGVSLVTTGPGGTNAITGVAGSWLDSVPHLVLSGQANLNQTIADSGLRQLGVQEINILDIIKPITKFSVLVKDPKKIKYLLQKAIYIATTGRPGPVWIDIPEDIQQAIIDEDELIEFEKGEVKIESDSKKVVESKVTEIVNLLKESKRPLLHVGQGVKIAKAEDEFLDLATHYKIPIITARNANDIIGSDDELFVGRQGMRGDRPANLALQNSDVLICLGTRLTLMQVGYDFKDFARNAKKIIVDIDKAELDKKTVCPDLKVHCDAGDFILELTKQMSGINIDSSGWIKQCQIWKKKYPVVTEGCKTRNKFVDTYYFVDQLSEVLDETDVIVTDMGLSFQGTHQAFKVKKGQKFYTSSGLASMGVGLPAAIGACIAHNKKRVICLAGDGGIQMNIQELQTVINYKLPIKLFIINNEGYLTIKQTQEMGLECRYTACNPDSNLSFPDMEKIARAYGFKYQKISTPENIKEELRKVVETEGPIMCELMSPDQIQSPRVSPRKLKDGTFVRPPLEDMYPFLDREELKRNMIAENE